MQPHSAMWRSIAYAVALRAAAAALADVGGGGEPTAAGATTAAGAAAGGITATAGGVMDPAVRGTEECWDRDVFCNFCDGCDCCDLGRQGLQKNAAQTRSVFREFYTTPAYASFLACAELSPAARQPVRSLFTTWSRGHTSGLSPTRKQTSAPLSGWYLSGPSILHWWQRGIPDALENCPASQRVQKG